MVGNDVKIETLKRIEIIIREFFEQKIWIATAESCTGGYIAHMITNISGASNIFERGVVTYSNQSKIDILNVDAKAIEEHGAVSEIVAWQMAHNIRKLASVNIGIGVTGLAGPTGETPDKPLGLVYIGFSTEKETFVKKYIFKTDRISFKEKVLEEVIEYLESFL